MSSMSVTAYGVLGRLRMAVAMRRSRIARSVAQTAGFNLVATAAGGLGGIIIARAFGPTVRGEYAAVTAWMGVLLTVGGMGQPRRWSTTSPGSRCAPATTLRPPGP